MATAQATMDGSRIKAFVADEHRFLAYVDKKFDALDPDHDGIVTQAQLRPVVESLGGALGLPPMGTSAETDHIYDEVFEEFTGGNGRNSVNKQVFGRVLKDVLLGLADGLERDPITMMRLDGSQLREYATSERLEVETVSVFTRLDVMQEGQLPASRLLDVLHTISVVKGMPPVTALKVQKLVEEAVRMSGLDAEYLDQTQFVDALRKLLLALADALKSNPLNVAHSEKQYDGQSIKKLLKNHDELHKILEESWKRMPKDRHHKVSKDYLRVGVDDVAPAAGLPPIGSAEEIDDVLVEIFQKFNFDDGEKIDHEGFKKCIKEILGSLMLHLEGKPVTIKSSEIVKEEEDQ